MSLCPATRGAATWVILEDIRDREDRSIVVEGRAVSASRVLFDADDALADKVGGHVQLASTVTVENGEGIARRSFRSTPGAPFTLDLFPHSLRELSRLGAHGLEPYGVPGWVVPVALEVRPLGSTACGPGRRHFAGLGRVRMRFSARRLSQWGRIPSCPTSGVATRQA